MIAFKIQMPGWASELINPPWIQFGIIIAFVSAVYVIPWFHVPGTISFTAGGLPDWVALQITSFVFIALSLAVIVYYGWGINPVVKAETFEQSLSLQSDATSIVPDSDNEASAYRRNVVKKVSASDETESTTDSQNSTSDHMQTTSGSDVELESEHSPNESVEMVTTAV